MRHERINLQDGRPIGGLLEAGISFPSAADDGCTEQVRLEDLTFTIVAAFRGHAHINNVLTHISGGDWKKVNDALRAILDPLASSRELSPLAHNLIDLMCAERGVTGRVLKPYFRELLELLLAPPLAERLAHHVAALFLDRIARGKRFAGATGQGERPC